MKNNRASNIGRIYKNAFDSKVSVYEKWKIPTSNKVGGYSDYGTEVSNSISVGSSETGGKFFYHSDHLGSTSYITNFAGEVTQHHEYVPFGETFVSEYKNARYNSPYRFNSKEFDSNTGFYYYGARYYNPKTSVWLGVDPLVEQTMQAYSFSNLNPVRFIDPTGMSAEDPNPPRLYTNTTNAKGILQNGFNGTEYGKYSNYNWFSTTSNAGGTGRTGQGVTLGIDGIDVSNAVEISNKQIKTFYEAAKSELGYTSEQLKNSAKLRSEVDGLKFKKLGSYMDEIGASSYKVGKNYAISDAVANKGILKTIQGSSASVRALNGLKIAGKTLAVIGISLDLYAIHSSGYNPRTITSVTGGWAGAWAGAKLGGAIGTGIGVWIGGVGEIITGPVGSVVGGIGGYFGGKAVSETVYDKIITPGFKINQK